MTSATPPVIKSERRLARWMMLVIVMLVAPIVVVGVGVVSMFRLDRDAAALRREVMAATDAEWSTKVQVSAGWVSLGLVRTGLRFVQHENMDDARLALSSVRNVSVGVYDKVSRGQSWSRDQLLTKTDERMRKRGWTRLVGVTEENQAVLVYATDAIDTGDRMDLCLAVVDGDEMVIVSTNVDAGTLLKLAERHMPEGGFGKKVKLAKLAL
ncbi:hypothetical protein Verru16b_03105 [Lacunisphaera limnophila]|uniref:DUF4252 domain-containing protein n=1 Tax=Lacunisphaera limnophila TaxID=1838286 RepID=A0A1D8AYS8_9BACT|nr:hypothetical protein [Lacunisphaera limnophila]AOS46011.1 hypothetical protein Verru16b_03105 [Lacunisphaera limnophila]